MNHIWCKDFQEFFGARACPCGHTPCGASTVEAATHELIGTNGDERDIDTYFSKDLELPKNLSTIIEK